MQQRPPAARHGRHPSGKYEVISKIDSLINACLHEEQSRQILSGSNLKRLSCRPFEERLPNKKKNNNNKNSIIIIYLPKV